MPVIEFEPGHAQAGKHNVVPVDGSAIERGLVERPFRVAPLGRYMCFRGPSVLYLAAPRLLIRPHSITADAEIRGTAPTVCCYVTVRSPAAIPSACNTAADGVALADEWIHAIDLVAVGLAAAAVHRFMVGSTVHRRIARTSRPL